jgi:O-antigen ligase
MTQAAPVSIPSLSVEASSPTSRRHVRAVAALALVLLVPLLAGIAFGGTTVTNTAGGVALIAAAIALGVRFDRKWLRAPASHAVGGLLVFLGIFVVAWQWQVGDLWINSELLLYSATALALPAFTAWFRESRERGAKLAFELKLGAVIGSSLLVLGAVLSLPDDPGAVQTVLLNPPGYGHLRHFNNEQLPAIAFAIYFASLAKSRGAQIAWFFVVTAMGFLMAWSGGRGVILSVGIFLALVALWRVLPQRAVTLGCAALALGALLVLFYGQADLFLRLFFSWSGPLNDVSNNRMDIWLGSIGVWRESWLSVLFGFGPDAMRTSISVRIGFPAIHHPHNGFVQALVDFGLIGLGLFTAAVAVIARRILAILRARTAPSEVRVAAALLAAFGAYMLNDGIVYHAIPLTMVMLLTAYLFSYRLEPDGRTADASPIAPEIDTTDSGR